MLNVERCSESRVLGCFISLRGANAGGKNENEFDRFGYGGLERGRIRDEWNPRGESQPAARFAQFLITNLQLMQEIRT